MEASSDERIIEVVASKRWKIIVVAVWKQASLRIIYMIMVENHGGKRRWKTQVVNGGKARWKLRWETEVENTGGEWWKSKVETEVENKGEETEVENRGGILKRMGYSGEKQGCGK